MKRAPLTVDQVATPRWRRFVLVYAVTVCGGTAAVTAVLTTRMPVLADPARPAELAWQEVPRRELIVTLAIAGGCLLGWLLYHCALLLIRRRPTRAGGTGGAR